MLVSLGNLILNILDLRKPAWNVLILYQYKLRQHVYRLFYDSSFMKWQKARDSHEDATCSLNVRLCQSCTTKQSHRLWVIPKLSIISWNPVRRTCGSGIYNPALVTSCEWYEWGVSPCVITWHTWQQSQRSATPQKAKSFVLPSTAHVSLKSLAEFII